MKRVVLGAASGAALGIALVVRTTLRAPLFDANLSAPSGPRLLSSLPSPFWLIAAVGLLALAGAVLGRRGWERFATPFLASGLAGAVFLPGVFSAAPCLASFGGRFLDFVLAIGILLVLGRLWRRLPVGSSWTATFSAVDARALGLAAFALYLAVGLHLSRTVGLSGDEPHYLLVTYSLLHDGDLRVQNNYAAEDYRRFYGGRIGPHLAAGTPYSVHGVLVSLLMLPGFALGGLAGVVVTEAILAALLLATIYGTAKDLTASPGLGLFAAAGFGLTAPGLFLGLTTYPEVPAALVVALVFRRLLDPEPPRPVAAFGWAVAIGAIVFLHVKFVPLAAILAGAMFWRYRRKSPAVFGLAGGAGAATVAVLLFSYATTGSLDPTASYGHQRIFLERLPIGIAGLLFDQEFGLLPSAPVFLLGLVGIPSLFRVDRLLGTVALAAVLSVMLPGAAHPLWTGGNAPPARFLFPALPLLVVAGAALVRRDEEKGASGWAPFLLAVSLAIAGAMLVLPDQPLYLNSRDGTGRVWEALSSSWNLTDYLPSLVRADVRSIAWAWALGGLLLVLTVVQWARRRWLERLPPAAACLLAAAILQDATGVGHSRVLEPRWVLDVMRGLGEHAGDTFVELPSLARLASSDLLHGSVALALEADPGDGDPRYSWSRGYSLPPGRFELEGVQREGAAFCNGESCFAFDRLELVSRVALLQFRVRARRRSARARLVLVDPVLGGSGAAAVAALATLPLDGGARLHALDDEAYLDPGGFWVKASSRASFALESETPAEGPAPVRLRLANGGVRNRVVVATPASTEAFVLSPFEERDVIVVGDGPVRLLTVESETGFRPSELDPGSGDDRLLGVRLLARPSL